MEANCHLASMKPTKKDFNEKELPVQFYIEI